MNRDTARAIIAAAALMTVQALLLAVLASGASHASTVYRCTPTSAGGAMAYQMHPCAEGAGAVPVRTADARTRDQQSQANATHARQMAWLDRQESKAASGTKARAPAKKRRTQRQSAKGPHGPHVSAAVPLTSHRIGRRPFEGLGQQPTLPDRSVSKPKKPRRSTSDFLARTPAPKAPQQHDSSKIKTSQ